MKGELLGNIEPSLCSTLSDAARQRMLWQQGEPLFLADWLNVLMLHLEVEPETLGRALPFPLDRFDGRAFVTLVFFTMRHLRPRRGGRLMAWLFHPIATHAFLNVRTYVRAGDESGIYFLAEWLTNPWSVAVGPPIFGLPYRLGRIAYRTTTRELSGQVTDLKSGTELSYRGRLSRAARFAPCVAGSLDEWLMERYTAFTHRNRAVRFFRVWHPPWSQCRARVELVHSSLLQTNWPWLADAEPMGANYSPGFQDVWMGRPHRLA